MAGEGWWLVPEESDMASHVVGLGKTNSDATGLAPLRRRPGNANRCGAIMPITIACCSACQAS
jgi:hypothetical protein